jgi:hypothetical protein
MKKARYLLAALIPVLALATAFTFLHISGARAANPNCTQTGFFRDNINLTAAMIDPTGTVKGPVNATGCNIGVYYDNAILSGTVKGAEVYGANYFGVVNNGTKVTVTKSKIHDIGESPFNGTQHGVGIYFAYASGANGTISNNTIWNYQKGGIVVDGVGDSATITHNTVLGFGPVNFIAQNGIELGLGSKGTITNNYVSGNSYSGSGGVSSGGILVFGGTCYSDALTIGVKVTGNTLRSNDVGVWLSNGDFDPNNPNVDCLPTQTPTKVVASNNNSSDDAICNTTGLNLFGQCCVYQAGISDQGDQDQVTGNKDCGVGYTTPQTPPPYLYLIDDTDTNQLMESNNSTCGNADAHSQSTRIVTSLHPRMHAIKSIYR